MLKWLVTLGFCAVAASAQPALGASSDGVARGQAILQKNCARCHAIGESGASPFDPAPPFRTLATRYPLEDLEEALAEGILSGHPAMPEFTFAPDRIADIIAYLKSLNPKPK